MRFLTPAATWRPAKTGSQRAVRAWWPVSLTRAQGRSQPGPTGARARIASPVHQSLSARRPVVGTRAAAGPTSRVPRGLRRIETRIALVHPAVRQGAVPKGCLSMIPGCSHKAQHVLAANGEQTGSAVRDLGLGPAQGLSCLARRTIGGMSPVAHPAFHTCSAGQPAANRHGQIRSWQSHWSPPMSGLHTLTTAAGCSPPVSERQ